MIRDDRLGFLSEAGGIIVRAHPLHPGHTGSGDHHAPGEQLIPRCLPNWDRLPGEQGLVRLHPPLQHQGVRRDLHSAFQGDHVPQHQLLHRKLPHFTIPQDAGLWGRQDGDLLHQFLGVELLDDPDDGVQRDDQDKQKVGPRPYQRQRDGNQDVEQVEQGAYMFPDNLTGGLCDGRRRRIAAPHLPQLLGLCLCQTVKR